MSTARLEESEKHARRVTVRFNETEYEIIVSRAEEAKIPVAAYVRQQAFGRDIIRNYNLVPDPSALKELVTEFGKIGTNLNQIARYFNTGGLRSLEVEDDIHDCIAMLFDLRKKVLEMGGEYRGSVKTHRKQKR